MLKISIAISDGPWHPSCANQMCAAASVPQRPGCTCGGRRTASPLSVRRPNAPDFAFSPFSSHRPLPAK